MNPRLYVAALAAFSIAASAIGAACTTEAVGFTPSPDGGTDATAPTSDARPGVGARPDEPGDDAAPAGRCSRVDSPECDIVLQNCPKRDGAEQQCVGTLGANDEVTAACVPVRPSQVTPLGYECCFRDGEDTCGPGLECAGGKACVDGGVNPGVCAPRCCPGDDRPCGRDPNGILGRCDLGIVRRQGDPPLYHVCTYDPKCQPFGIRPCPSGALCLPKDPSGTAECKNVFLPDGGTGGEGERCNAANACADGLVCVGSGSEPTTCHWMCLRDQGRPPFDRASLPMGVGTGACPQGKSCGVGVEGFPEWIGVCE
jgi:hypothetical protein